MAKIFGDMGGDRNGSSELWIFYKDKKPKNNEKIYAQYVDALGMIHLTELTYDAYDWKKEKELKMIAWFPLPAPIEY